MPSSDLVDASLSARRRYGAIAVIPAMVADNAGGVVLHVTAQLQAVAQKISRHHLLRFRDIALLIAALDGAAGPLFRVPEDAWYRIGQQELPCDDQILASLCPVLEAAITVDPLLAEPCGLRWRQPGPLRSTRPDG